MVFRILTMGWNSGLPLTGSNGDFVKIQKLKQNNLRNFNKIGGCRELALCNRLFLRYTVIWKKINRIR